ncbi:hypothetical protein BDV06DRAFT_226950 [Aspergillus oleicola]
MLGKGAVSGPEAFWWYRLHPAVNALGFACQSWPVFDPARKVSSSQNHGRNTVTFAIANDNKKLGDIGFRGQVTDLVIHVTNGIPDGHFDRSEVCVAMVIKPNALPIDMQIDALRKISDPCVFGDLEDSSSIDKNGRGFSLIRMMLAQGRELDDKSQNYFTLNITTLPRCQNTSRTSQKLKGGIHLIEGLSETGKTTVSVTIVLVLADLRIPVMIAAGPDNEVDNLSRQVAKALDKRKCLRYWTGNFYRDRTLSRQYTKLCNQSSGSRSNQRLNNTTASPDVLGHMVWTDTFSNMPSSTLATATVVNSLNSSTQKLLGGSKESYRRISSRLLDSATIAATVLTNVATLSLLFRPMLLVCDDPGQGTEGEHAIALTYPSLRGVILVGDAKLTQTIVSECQCNENAPYLRRSLVERLERSHYPCTMLKSNHRSHAQILKFFDNSAYGFELILKA